MKKEEVHQKIKDCFSSGRIIGEAENKAGETFFVVFCNFYPLWSIYLVNTSRFQFAGSPQIIVEIEPDYNTAGIINIKSSIIDVEPGKEREGNGTLLIIFMLNVLRELGAEYVTGYISPEYMKTFYKSEKFFKKFGVEVILDEIDGRGEINKVLNNTTKAIRREQSEGFIHNRLNIF